MKKIILLIIIIISSCNKNSKNEFSLTGTINGMKNGTVLYIDYDNKVLDSAIIEQNNFVFNTKLPIYPIQIWLHSKNSYDFKPIWVENKPMTLKGIKSDLKNSEITGSVSENMSQKLEKEVSPLSDKERVKKEIEFVKLNPNSILSANLLHIYSSTWGKEETEKLYNEFSPENKNSEYGKRILRFIKLNKNPKIGDKYVDFEMTNLSGSKKKLSDYKGNIILLEFWASWCSPCRKENPNLLKTYNKYKENNFEIFAVSLDVNRNEWISAIKKDSLKWEHFSELNGMENTARIIYGISGIPENFLIAENGVIIGRNLRGEKLNQKLREIFK